MLIQCKVHSEFGSVETELESDPELPPLTSLMVPPGRSFGMFAKGFNCAISALNSGVLGVGLYITTGTAVFDEGVVAVEVVVVGVFIVVVVVVDVVVVAVMSLVTLFFIWK